MLRDSEVFSRTDGQGATLSDATYNLVIGLVLCWGFLVNWVIVREVDTAWVLSIDSRAFFVGYLASCLLGCCRRPNSDHPCRSNLDQGREAVSETAICG